jgi:hypothetical protein
MSWCRLGNLSKESRMALCVVLGRFRAGEGLGIEQRLFCIFEEDHFVLKYAPARPARLQDLRLLRGLFNAIRSVKFAACLMRSCVNHRWAFLDELELSANQRLLHPVGG